MLKVTANENKTILVRFVIVSLLFRKFYKFIFQTNLSLLLHKEVYHLEPLFYRPLLSPLLGIYIVKAFISVFFSLPLFVQMWTSLSSGQVYRVDKSIEWTSWRVDKLTSCLRRRQSNRWTLRWRVDKLTSRQVNKLLAKKTK